jgi:hypothetical protein
VTEHSEVIPETHAERPLSGIHQPTSRWRRLFIIVAVFTAVAPLLGGTLAVLIWETAKLLDGASVPAPLDMLDQWTQWVGYAYLFGAPCALVIGLVFGALAVFAGRSQLWLALAPSILLLLPLQSVVGDPIWRFGIPFTLIALSVFMLPTALAWSLTRPWHRP